MWSMYWRKPGDLYQGWVLVVTFCLLSAPFTWKSRVFGRYLVTCVLLAMTSKYGDCNFLFLHYIYCIPVCLKWVTLVDYSG